MSQAQTNKVDAGTASPRPPIRQLSHTAIRTTQMERIRCFYEDILGLPLTTTVVANEDPTTGENSNYIHCFFQLGDGSSIAFFQFEAGFHGSMVEHTRDPFERHMALRVDSFEDVEAFRVRATEFGVQSLVVNHEDFYSLYLTDPEGDQIEITWHKPSFQATINPELAKLRLSEWLSVYGSKTPTLG